jgi:hypothetical protein
MAEDTWYVPLLSLLKPPSGFNFTASSFVAFF